MHANNLQRHRRWNFKKYGVSQEWFDKKYQEQDGKCAICNIPIEKLGKGTAIDHNHENGKARGILCKFCNTNRVGKVEDFERFQKTDWYDRVKEYIRKYS